MASLSPGCRHYLDQVRSHTGHIPPSISKALIPSDFLPFCLFAFACFCVPSGLYVRSCAAVSCRAVVRVYGDVIAYRIAAGSVVSSSLHSTSGSSRKRTMWSRITVGTGATASSSVVHSSFDGVFELAPHPMYSVGKRTPVSLLDT